PGGGRMGGMQGPGGPGQSSPGPMGPAGSSPGGGPGLPGGPGGPGSPRGRMGGAGPGGPGAPIMPDGPAVPGNGPGFPGQGGAAEQAPSGSLVGRPDTYMTINQPLKNMLDRMEDLPEDTKVKILMVSATDLTAARADGQPLDTHVGLAWQFRQTWDVTKVLE